MSVVPGTLEHRSALRRGAFLKIVLSLCITSGAGFLRTKGFVFGFDMATAFLFADVMMLASLVPWFWGLSDWAVGKGYGRWLMVLGILKFVPLLIIVVFLVMCLLPDRYRLVAPVQPVDANSNYPRGDVSSPPLATENPPPVASPFVLRTEPRPEPKPVGNGQPYKRPY